MTNKTAYQIEDYYGLKRVHMDNSRSASIAPFTCYTFIYVIEGSATYVVGSNKTRVVAGDCLCLLRNPEAKLQIYSDRISGQFDALMLDFPRMFLVDCYRQLTTLPPTIYRKPQRHYAVQMPKTDRLKKFCETGIELWGKKELLQQAEVTELRRQIVERVLTIDNTSAAFFFDFLPQYRCSVRDFIERYYRLHLSVDEMAVYTSRSKSAFKRDTMQEMGTSPESAVMNVRLQNAHLLLKEGKRPIDIYKYVGFVSYQHFASRYKDAFGYTPTQTLEME